jgi:hypothetical protein
LVMSDHPRLSAPSLSSSGGRLPPIARPDWPWAARSYSQRNQQPSPHPGGQLQGSTLQNSWDPRSSISSNSQSGYSAIQQGRNTSTPKPLPSSMNTSVGESTRQWTFTVWNGFLKTFLFTLTRSAIVRDLNGLFVVFTSLEILWKGLIMSKKAVNP